MIILHDLQWADSGTPIASNSYNRFVIVLQKIYVEIFVIDNNSLGNPP